MISSERRAASVRVITAKDLELAWGTTLSPSLKAQVASAHLQYKQLSSQERDAYILHVIEELLNPSVSVSGAHRLPDWEKGWHENLIHLQQTKSPESLIPKYHRKHQILHWRQDLIKSMSSDYDLKIHRILVDYVFEKYLSKQSVVYEFGCGPAYQLLHLRKFNPSAYLVGLDWTKTSVRIINQIKAMGIDTNMDGRVFDFFKPDHSLVISPNSGVYTIAALEQVGGRYEPFIQFLLRQKPALCVHLEPLEELLNQDHLVDRLSLLYFQKRNYLRGFLARLRELRDQGRIVIHREQRTYTGSYFIEGHSLVVWSPI